MTRRINLQINGISIEVSEGTTILKAAEKLGLRIPTLCFHEDLRVAGNCRVCMVELKGARTLPAACATPVADGMEIFTNTLQVRQARKHIIELLYSEHSGECATCYRSGDCELQNLAHEYIIEAPTFLDISGARAIDRSSPAIQKNDGKCIRCQRCVRTCLEIQTVGALTAAHKGYEMRIETFFDKPLHNTACTFCGQCVAHCPTGALVERNYIEEVWQALGCPGKHVVVQTAPAVRVALGEALGMPPGERVTGKMVTALRKMGFHAVFDTNFTADLTIMEEGHELLKRFKAPEADVKPLPMITSCSPAWIKFIEHEYPEFLPHLSTCKSPQQMFGVLAKSYYAQKADLNPESLVVVSIMPCTAKKFEADRMEMKASGFKDVDYVLTTREFALMIRQAGIDFQGLEDSACDSLLGEHTGAGVIFGVTGGVMEAALRTVYEIVTGREIPFPDLDVTAVRGLENVRESVVNIEGPMQDWAFLDGIELRIAVAHGLGNARKLMENMKSGEAQYHFIEIMACPGGCLGGGGQPLPLNAEILQKRAQALYAEEKSRTYRKSHENPEILKLYRDFLHEPQSSMSHKLLHTAYSRRGKA